MGFELMVILGGNMARKIQLINPLVEPGQLKVAHPTDWTKCILCQVVTSECLQCPVESTHSNKDVGYNILSENLRFYDLKELPIKY